jgi:hypothetical protein
MGAFDRRATEFDVITDWCSPIARNGNHQAHAATNGAIGPTLFGWSPERARAKPTGGLLLFRRRQTGGNGEVESQGAFVLKRLVSGAALVAMTGAMVFGGSSAAQATTVPDASCINSDPTGLVNVIVCTINTTVQVPVDLPDSVITIGDVASGNDIDVLTNAELDAVEVTIKDVLNNTSVEDNLVFKSAVVDALNDADIIDDIDVSKVFVDIL